MHHHTHTTRFQVEVDDFAAELFRHVVRRLKGRRLHDCDDIAQRVCLVFLQQPEAIMAKYGDADRFAAAVAHNAEVSFDRWQRSQRGEGVALDTDDDGTMRPRRRYVSGNAPMRGADGEAGGGEYFDRILDTSEAFTDQVIERVDGAALLGQCMTGLSTADRDALWRIAGNGEAVIDVAAERGVARETLSRRMGVIRRAVQQNVAAMQRTFPTDPRPTA